MLYDYPTAAPQAYPVGQSHRVTNVPSIAEQMGVDPISRLAKAIERLAAAIEQTE
jgi:hypothetical protein